MRFRKAVIILASLASIAAAGWFFGGRSITRYTCLECRAVLTKCRVCGFPFQDVTPNSYSESVLAHNSSHQHQWRWSGSEKTYTLFSAARGCGQQHPIWQLPVSVQERYSHLVSEAELQGTLKAIDSSDRETAESIIQKIHERVLESQ